MTCPCDADGCARNHDRGVEETELEPDTFDGPEEWERDDDQG